MSLYFSHAAAPPVGCRLVAVDGRTIPLRDVHVQADAGGGLARVVLQQRFDNDLSDPLAATYQLPLPADGAVVGFSFQIGDQRIVGEIDGKERARQRYEEALAQGRSAAILEQDRSSLFTQELGNIPPGVSITAEITIEQPLAWRQDGWEWRFPTVVAPRFVGAGTTDAERVSVDVADGPMAATVRLTMAIRDAPAWHDLDADGRRDAFKQTVLVRTLEAAMDPKGLSSTARVVLSRIRSRSG